MTFMPLISDLSLTPGGGAVTFGRSSSGNTYVDAVTGLVTIAAANTPRFEAAGLLIEGDGDNFLLYSAEFNQPVWAKSDGATVVADAAISPDGGLNADEIDVSQSSNLSRISQDLSLGGGRTYTFSVWLKARAGESGLFPLKITTAGGSVVAELLADIDDAGWKRFEVTATNPNGLVTAFIGDSRVSGATLLTCYAWGAQLEELIFASSYIPTQSTSRWRYLDSLGLSPVGFPALNLDYSISAEISLLGKIPISNQYLWHFVGTQYRYARLDYLSEKPEIQVYDSGGSSLVATVAALGETSSLVQTKKGSLLSVYIDGAVTTAEMLTEPAPEPFIITIGSGPNESGGLYGHIKSFRVDSVALTAEEAAQL